MLAINLGCISVWYSVHVFWTAWELRFPISVATAGRFRRRGDFWRSILSAFRLKSLESREDSNLLRVFDFTLNGWPAHITDTYLQPFFDRRNDLPWNESDSVGYASCCPWEVESSTVAGALARGYLCCPYLDWDIADMIERCSACASTRSTPKESHLNPWLCI